MTVMYRLPTKSVNKITKQTDVARQGVLELTAHHITIFSESLQRHMTPMLDLSHYLADLI